MQEEDPIADFLQWYRERNLVTKVFLTVSFLLALSTTSLFGWNPRSFYYTYYSAIEMGEIWRTVTALFFLGRFDLSYFLQAYLSYLILYYTEKDLFKRQDWADYLMLTLFIYLFIFIFASAFDIYFLAEPFLYALLIV
jgi:hypothetical protein